MDAMITGNCFFTSDGEIGQSFIIFQILGTPNEDKQNGISKLKYFSFNFPQWKPRKIKDIFLNFDKDSLDLMEKFLQIDTVKELQLKIL